MSEVITEAYLNHGGKRWIDVESFERLQKKYDELEKKLSDEQDGCLQVIAERDMREV